MANSIYNMLNGISQKIGFIEKDVKDIANSFAEDVSSQAADDLKEAHQKIIDKFYDAYDPNRYNRSYNLYNSGIVQNAKKIGEGKYSSGIIVGSFYMMDIYNISPDNVFDLMWNQGIRGLPKESSDGSWVNPYWNPEIYQNIFLTSIKVGNNTTITGTPNEVMDDFVNKWGIKNGVSACEKAEKRIVNKYNKVTY